MSFILANFLGNSPANSDQVEDKQLIIEKLTAKMVNSAHLEDRKAAAQTIKSLARSHRLEIGTLALQALIDELRRDLEDEELAKIVLETLDILCSSKEGEEGIEVQFCEILLKNDQNITLLLDLMGDSDDFYLKFTSIQILMSLCNSQPFQLQLAVLNSPSGVEKVLNLLQDSREIVRNEGLLFCGALVRGSTDLQKILAFQGAFEQVMKIIVEEESGPWEGQIIVQDAFNLLFELLNLNTANQTYFRDSICFKQLAGLLAFPSSTEENCLWNRTRISNYLASLSLLDGILCKSNVDLEASQNAAMRTHFFIPLLQLAFNPKVPQEVSASALNCLSGMIWSNSRAQHELAKEKLPFNLGIKRVEPPISPLMAAVCLTVHGNPSAGNVSEEAAINQRIKALELVESFCTGNFDGQLVLLSTLKSTSDSSASPGSVILEALFDLDTSRKRDPWHCWFASSLLCHLINGNEEAKKMLLKHRMIDADGEEDEDILTAIMLNLMRIARDSRGSTCQKSIIGYLQLMLVWFHESPVPVKHFLQEGSYVQYLIERITHQSHQQDIQIQGIAALILGICVLFNDESVPNFGSEALKSVIKNRIGPDLFISKLSRLKSEKNDLVSAVLLKNYDNLVKLVARPTPAGTKASHTATLAQLTKDLSECRALLTDTQSYLTQSEGLIETLKIGISERDAYILQLQKIISAKNQKIAQMAHEMSNLEQQQLQLQQSPNEYYERYLADQAALQNLNATIKSFQETVARQQARIEELEALLSGKEGEGGELAKWKEAYHELYKQVQSQLNFDSTAESGNPSETDKLINSDIALLIQASTKDVVLSPSMFMSPLAEESSVSVISEEPVIVYSQASQSSPELITLNQLPATEKLNEYPELKESLDTTFNAAVIVSEEYALKDPNPVTDEKFIQSISAECPPDNFLDSDPNEVVEIVSQEEIKNVLGFFDELPEVQVEGVREELKAMSIGNIGSEVKAENVVMIDEPKPNEYTLPVPEQDYTVQDQDYSVQDQDYTVKEQDYSVQEQDYSVNEQDYTVPEPIEHEQTEADTLEPTQCDTPTQDSVTYESTQNIEPEHELTAQSDEIPLESQDPFESTGTQTFDYFSNSNNDDFTEAVVEPESVSVDEALPVITHEPNGEIVHDYANTEQDNTFNFNYTGTTETAASLSSYPEYSAQQESSNISDYPTDNDYTQDYTVSTSEEQQVYSEDQGQEYSTSEYQNEYQGGEYSQEYGTEYQADYYEHASQAVEPEYAYELYDQTQTFESYDQTQTYEQPQTQTYEQSQTYEPQTQTYEQSQDSQAQSQSFEYAQDSQAQIQSFEQSYEPQAQTQTYEQSHEAQDYTQAQTYEQPQGAYSESFDQVQEIPQTHYDSSNQSYGTNQAYETSNQAYDTQQQQESSEYYYYDEATGYTYGFDQNVNQYYYYDPNTGQYTYYTAAEAEYTDTAEYNAPVAAEYTDAAESNSSAAASNPSLFDTSGPPMVSLQQHQPHPLSTSNFVADQVYNL